MRPWVRVFSGEKLAWRLFGGRIGSSKILAWLAGWVGVARRDSRSISLSIWASGPRLSSLCSAWTSIVSLSGGILLSNWVVCVFCVRSETCPKLTTSIASSTTARGMHGLGMV